MGRVLRRRPGAAVGRLPVKADGPTGDTAGSGLVDRLLKKRSEWRDACLTALLVVQVLTIFVLVPLADGALPIPPGFVSLFLLVFMSMTIFAAEGRWTLSTGIGTLALNGGVAVAAELRPGFAADLAFDLASLATFAILGVVVAIAVFRRGPFTTHRVRGAIVLYLNFGLLFAFLHRLVAELAPGAYAHIPDPRDKAAFRAVLDYYSFATITSLGAGDISPVTPLARSFSTLEAGLGQLLPTLLIGRVLSMRMREEGN